jgi:hypothetical protein
MKIIYRVKYWYERPGGLPLGLRVQKKPKDGAGIPGVVRFYKDDVMLMTPAWHSFWKALLRQMAPPVWTDAQIDKAYQSLIDPGRFATNFSIPPFYKLMSLTCGGNYLIGDDNPVWKAGALYVKIYTLDSLKPPPDPSVVNFKTRPDLIQLAVNERIARLPDGTYPEEPFPQLGGNDVPFPMVARNGYDWILLEAVEKVDRIGQKGYYNIGTVAQNIPAIIYEQKTIEGLTVHIHRVDARKAQPFVTPNGPTTTQEALNHFQVLGAWNADQWSLSNPSIPTGRSMTNGVWNYKSNMEQSVWFGQKPGQVEISGSPLLLGFTPYNVVSFPMRLVQNGAPAPRPVNKPFNDTFRAARTAFGFSKDRLTYIIVTVEGDEDKLIGATELQMARIMAGLAYQAVLFDGGSSTQVSSKYLDYHSNQPDPRQIINCLCFA